MTHHPQREMIHRVAAHGLRIHSGYFTAYGYSTDLLEKGYFSQGYSMAGDRPIVQGTPSYRCQ